MTVQPFSTHADQESDTYAICKQAHTDRHGCAQGARGERRQQASEAQYDTQGLLQAAMLQAQTFTFLAVRWGEVEYSRKPGLE